MRPELLAEGGQREVRVDLRDRDPPADRREAGAKAHAHQAAAGERVEALDHLVARPERIGERVEPDVDPSRGRDRTGSPSGGCRGRTATSPMTTRLTRDVAT